MQVRCPVCNCSVDVAEGEGGLVCPGCGELLAYAASGGACRVYIMPEDEDSYEWVAREYERAVDAGEYERAERLRRELERMMGETSEEEEIDLEETEGLFSEDGYAEPGDEEWFDEGDLWDEEGDGYDEDLGEEF